MATISAPIRGKKSATPTRRPTPCSGCGPRRHANAGTGFRSERALFAVATQASDPPAWISDYLRPRCPAAPLPRCPAVVPLPVRPPHQLLALGRLVGVHPL